MRLQLLDQLHLVALKDSESKSRRSKAAFEYAFTVLNTVQDSVSVTGDINKALETLLLAAHLEHREARSIVSWLYASFGRPMPIDPDLELEWTYHAAERGSRAAEQRLKVLDQQLSSKARQTLRYQFAGVGYETKMNFRHPEAEVWYVAKCCEDPSFAPRHILHSFATVGHGDSFKLLVHSGRFDINERIKSGETPLLQACRSGHAHIVDILIKAGADASIGSDENLQPLHFLSSFDNHDIPRIAKLLKDNGSDVHARTNDVFVYPDRLDARFGQEDGTPLLWAVIADCTTAVVVLLELGADPFDGEGKKVPVSDSWNDLVHRSPVDWAAWKHQYHMLELLIPEPQWPFMTSLLDLLPDQLPRNSPKWQLNNSFRNVGTRGAAVLPLIWAVDSEIGLARRMFYHGANHKEACLKTVDLLLRRGADPHKLATVAKKTGLPVTALDLACQRGQPYLVEFLLDYKAGMLRPGIKDWCNLLITVVTMSDRVTFEILLKYRPPFSKDESSSIEAILSTLAGHMDEVDFLHQLNSLLLQTNGGLRPNFSAQFEIALYKGNLKAARFFFENGICDLETSRENETLLTRLIVKSKLYRNVGKKIEFFLSLIPDTDLNNDRIFWSVCSSRESDRDLYTALHLATFHTEFRPRFRSDHSVLQVLLERFHEPRYLNAQVGGQNGEYIGFTALHLAVAGGNIPATDMLLQQANNGLDINKLNAHGESPVDVGLLRMRSGKRDLEYWDIEERDQEIEEHHRDERTISLLSHLHIAGARYHRYSQVVTRTEERVIFILNLGGGSAGKIETPGKQSQTNDLVSI
jgi:ankyrin repeat protein